MLMENPVVENFVPLTFHSIYCIPVYIETFTIRHIFYFVVQNWCYKYIWFILLMDREELVNPFMNSGNIYSAVVISCKQSRILYINIYIIAFIIFSKFWRYRVCIWVYNAFLRGQYHEMSFFVFRFLIQSSKPQ
jgi:hypothetical protein